ncbi:hypothetical protein OCK74_27260 [Chitinophagaceae bacterium LB-8]|uniref:Uncharacterized protein n=1 Tax=Paraflavisolibacter caeni TaxID=2982496 RepID=A0A9X3BKE8_9BACT|nr:hypothetical protein [Paraflavisolibacter caeni]MCU7552848.1 hypothetical protein [Paraflavisolibacter caeni]
MEDSINIEEIITLVKKQEPERADVIEALQKCSGGKWTSKGYYQFINSKNANEPGAAWQIDESIVLEQENKGDIVLDILKDGRIGGIEFIDLIEN